MAALLLGTSWAASATNAWFDNLWLDDGLPGKTVWTSAEDSLGFRWTGGEGGLARFDGRRLEAFPFAHTQGTMPANALVRDFAIAQDDTLWIGTLDHGAWRAVPYARPGYPSLLEPVETEGRAVRSILLHKNDVYAGTSAGLERWNPETRRFQPTGVAADSGGVTAIHEGPNDDLFLGTTNGLIRYFPRTGTSRPMASETLDGLLVFAIDNRSTKELWVGTSQGLARVAIDGSSAKFVPWISQKTAVFSVAVAPQGVWIGTRDDGLIHAVDGRVINRFEHHPREAGSLSDWAVTSVKVDRTGTLWAGTFSGGLDRLDTSTLKFGWHDATSTVFSCLPDSKAHAFLPLEDELWIGTGNGLSKVDQDAVLCQSIPTEGRGVMDIVQSDSGEIWTATTAGPARVDASSGSPILGPVLDKHFAYFIANAGPNTLIYGSPDGLSRIDTQTMTVIRVSINANSKQPSVYAAEPDNDGIFWLATSQGVYRWNAAAGAAAVDLGSALEDAKISVLTVGGSSIWLGGPSIGLVEVDSRTYQTTSYFSPDQAGDIMGIVERPNALWITTSNGLYRLERHNGSVQHYKARDGLQSDVFIRDATAIDSNGRMYLGGRRGWNVFFPEDITPNLLPPKVALTGLMINNSPVIVDARADGPGLPAAMELLPALSLSDRDDNIGIEFAALHFADPSRNIVQYMLDGFDREWTTARPGQEVATYTNLPWGEFVFRVRAANKDGVWNNKGLVIPVHVATPLWARWWALLAYLAAAVCITLGYAHYRSAASRRRARELQITVDARTRELAAQNQRVQEQKTTIEQLLARKNALFANVSHEFRTPLTLILGPLDQMIEQAKEASDKSLFERLRRNAERLLHLVDQLLFLARTTGALGGQQREVLHPDEPLRYLVTSFQPLAQEKDIRLVADIARSAAIYVGQEAFESMVSNLLSNAVKYTPRGGSVRVSLTQQSQSAQLSVADSGPGLSVSEQATVFERFTRLASHQTTQGTGIGLALVRELAEAHGGDVSVQSTPGEGSQFMLTLPLALTDHEVSAPPAPPPAEPVDTGARDDPASRGQQLTALIIDDDGDMCDYVAECLSADFACAQAGNGKQGMVKALDLVPDVIICDVMMPEMDGFEFSRRVREDERLSHIPIVLLSARGSRDSRIQGWDSYIDDYLVKPFDRRELRVRLQSLIKVRELLRGEVFDEMTTRGQSTKLNPKEQAFVDRLNAVLEKRFGEIGLTRPDIAADMAVSDRQLQRKLKALTDQNPSDYLREFRLRKAKELLAQGEQVALTSERCGFASPSQFGYAFKRRFGITPKKFQMGTARA